MHFRSETIAQMNYDFSSSQRALMESERSPSTETWHMDSHTAQVFLNAERIGRRRTVPANTVLYRQRDISSLLHFVVRGRVQVSVFHENGSEFILEVMGPWSICGEGGAIDGHPRIATATTIDECELIDFDFTEVRKVFSQHPELAEALLMVVAAKQRVLGMRIQFMASPKAELRIGELLGRLGDLYGIDTPAGREIGIPLTHEQIAALTGTTRVTVTRSLARLKADGVIDNRGKRFWIVDPSRVCA